MLTHLGPGFQQALQGALVISQTCFGEAGHNQTVATYVWDGGHHRKGRLNGLLGSGEVHRIDLQPQPIQTGYCRTQAVPILLDHLDTLFGRSQRLAPLSEKEMTFDYQMQIRLEIPREVRVLLVALQHNCKAFLRAPLRSAVLGGMEECVGDRELNLPQQEAMTGFTKLRDQVLALFQFFRVQFPRSRADREESPPGCPLKSVPLTGAR